MKKLVLYKRLLLVLIICGVVLSGFHVYNFLELRNTAFRLSPEAVELSLQNKVSVCSKLSECELSPGDILIRRYVTSRTKLFNYWFRPYFTHSAFYLGDDKIVEAVGQEKDSQDEIQIAVLSDSDWWDEELVNFVVIRPQYKNELLEIQDKLIAIADDLEYVFGLPEEGKKQATCADLIFNQLQKVSILEVLTEPEVITPDYLYKILGQDTGFELVGFSVGSEGK